MRIRLAAAIMALLIIPGIGLAQQAGSFVGGIELGITSALGDFRDATGQYRSWTWSGIKVYAYPKLLIRPFH